MKLQEHTTKTDIMRWKTHVTFNFTEYFDSLVHQFKHHKTDRSWGGKLMLQLTPQNTSTHSYANLNKWVFSLVLNTSTDVASRMFLGSSFQSFGALILNAALVRRYLEEKFRSSKVGSLSHRRFFPVGFFVTMRSFRYGGANPLMHLYVSSKILKSIRKLTGRKCRSFLSLVTPRRLLWLLINRTALFWTFCSRLISFFVACFRRALP